MRHHLFLQARNEEKRRATGASRARETANPSLNDVASVLHRPPVSVPTTTSWHRSLSTSSAYLVSLSSLALVSTAPSTVAAFGHALPLAVTALRRVMSTASCAPWFIANPDARTSIDRSSVACTRTFMSRSLDVAPHCGAGLPANSGQAALCWDSSGSQSAGSGTGRSVLSSGVQDNTALTPGVRDQQREPQAFEDDGAEEVWLHCELRRRG